MPGSGTNFATVGGLMIRPVASTYTRLVCFKGNLVGYIFGKILATHMHIRMDNSPQFNFDRTAERR